MASCARSRAAFAAALALVAALLPPAAGQLSRPVATPDDLDLDWNKFLQRTASLDLVNVYDFSEENVIERPCDFDLFVKWHRELHAGVHATPVIGDLFADGRKSVLVPLLRREVPSLDARTGERASEAGLFHEGRLLASPLLHDVDGDGTPDVVVATHGGTVLFFRQTGEPAAAPLHLAPLEVFRDWNFGSRAGDEFVDHAHPDVGSAAEDAANARRQEGQSAEEAATAERDAGLAGNAAGDGLRAGLAGNAAGDGLRAGLAGNAAGDGLRSGLAGNAATAGRDGALLGARGDRLAEGVFHSEDRGRGGGAAGGWDGPVPLHPHFRAPGTKKEAGAGSGGLLADDAAADDGSALGLRRRSLLSIGEDLDEGHQAGWISKGGAGAGRGPLSATGRPVPRPPVFLSDDGSLPQGASDDAQASYEALFGTGKGDGDGAGKGDGLASGADGGSGADGLASDPLARGAARRRAHPRHIGRGNVVRQERPEPLHFGDGDDHAPLAWGDEVDALPDDADLDLDAGAELETYWWEDDDVEHDDWKPPPDLPTEGRGDGDDDDDADDAPVVSDEAMDAFVHAEEAFRGTKTVSVGGAGAAGRATDEAGALGDPERDPETGALGDPERDPEAARRRDRRDQELFDSYVAGSPPKRPAAGKTKRRAGKGKSGSSSRSRGALRIPVDAHVLATPTIGDVDGDGSDELVLAVTYFFDPDEYEGSEHWTPEDAGAYERKLEEEDLLLSREHELDTLTKHRLWAARHSRRPRAGRPARRHHRLPAGVHRPLDYVACAAVAVDLRTRETKWRTHLDLSSAYAPFTAHALSPPALVDVDGDGSLEVVVGGSMGFLYVLDGATGEAREGWPVQMGPIAAAVAVGDARGDGAPVLLAGDLRGSVAAFDLRTGAELWERHLASAVRGGITLADADGDGALEAVVPTAAGALHLLRAADGSSKRGFPFQAGGALSARPSAVPGLRRAEGASAAPAPGDPLALVALAGDGLLYAVDAASGCAAALELGGAAHARVLVDDLDDDGAIELLAVTDAGGVYAIGSRTPFRPLAADRNDLPGRDGALARVGWRGVEVAPRARGWRDVRGRSLRVPFRVVDEPRERLERAAARERRASAAALADAALVGGHEWVKGGAGAGAGAGAAPAAALANATEPRYRVAVTLQHVGAAEMGAGDEPVIGAEHRVNASGSYALDVPCPRTRTTAVVRVELVDGMGLVSRDEFTVSFHLRFYALLKWLVALPALFGAAAVLAAAGEGPKAVGRLPSFRLVE